MGKHGPTCACWRCEGARLSLPERLRAATKIDPSGCHIFTGHLRRGYGWFQHRKVSYWAHRVALAFKLGYEDGVLPAEIVTRHTCDNPSCVNPDHLDPCSRGENTRREADRRTTCHRGHPWTTDNIVTFRDGRRTCATCLAESRARASAKRRSR